jgi:hypothetical protein
MRTLLLFLALALVAGAQSLNPHFRAAETALKAKDYRAALAAYLAGMRDTPGDSVVLYNAACCAAQTGETDMSFALLDLAFPANEEWLVGRTALTKDSDLEPLRTDPRWPTLLATVEKRYAEVQSGLYAGVKKELLAIHEADQADRKKLKDTEQQHGRESPEMQALWKQIAAADAANLPKVEAILTQHGWLGPKQIGPKANSAIFLVIQHADLPVQQKYLPMMRDAVKSGRASGSSLALLEDRIALREGRRQVYGSQIGVDATTGAHYVLPLEDPDHVDARRAAVGLPPLTDYVKTWNITWDVEAYKKQLPTLENTMAPPRR